MPIPLRMTSSSDRASATMHRKFRSALAWPIHAVGAGDDTRMATFAFDPPTIAVLRGTTKIKINVPEYSTYVVADYASGPFPCPPHAESPGDGSGDAAWITNGANEPASGARLRCA